MATSPSPNVASPEVIVLKPKLHVPSPRPEYLPRPRLLKLLKGGSNKITVIDAPPGYGKTTLLTQWCQPEGGSLPFAWVSLDEQDNDPVRLWAHVTEALRRIAPEEAFETKGFVELSINGRKLIEMALPVLINRLTEFPQRVTLILDDYHCIKESKCHELVTFFVEHLPETVHLILSTRYDLPLPLGRWRAKGEVNEIRAEQLAFSEEEATSLLKERLHLDINLADIRTLLDRTEGWPAGLYLAALSLQDKKDAHAFVESFRGNNRFIVEILAEEVLTTLSAEEREFLLQTSILERMSASVCEAVTEIKTSGKLLHELGNSNLFVVPLDDYHEWYRYHHLFADFLYYELMSTQPRLVPILHKRASEWFERAGLVEVAVHHAIAAGEYARVGLLVARHWLGYALRGQTDILERWLAVLPEELINGNAAITMLRAWICALYGRREETERFLALAEGSSYEGKLPDDSPSVETSVALVRGLFGYGGIQAAVAAVRRAEEKPPKQSSPLAPLMHLAAGMTLYHSGEISESRKALEQARRLSRLEQPILRIVTLCTLSYVATDEGHVEEAESLACEAREVVQKFGLEEQVQSSAVPIALGRALAARGEVAKAQSELEKGISVRRRFPSLSPWLSLVGLLALAPLRAARGDRAGARALLDEAHTIIETYPDAGMFPELLERRERELNRSKRQEGAHTQELTERELAVLHLLDEEHSNREIGLTLYVSPNTIKAHVKSIYRKLGVRSRKEAANQARARGFT